MVVVVLLLLPLLFSVTPAFAEQGFDPKYERDYNIFNPANQYDPQNPFNQANRFNPNTPFEPLNRPLGSER